MTAADLVVTARGLRFRNRYCPCALGREGISADKREGDGATPAGSHRVVAMFYRPDRMAAPAPWARPIRPGYLWSDDVDLNYNQMVRAPFAGSHERLWRADRLYDLVLVTDWNYPKAAANRGSAIFVHRWRKPGHPSEGCVTLSAGNLLWIAKRIVPGTRLVVQPLAPKMAEPTRT